jgi:hypothetical protein
VSVLTIPTLEIDADVDGDGTDETGVFELAPIDQDSQEALAGLVRTGFLLNNEFPQLAALASDVLGDGETSNKGIHFNIGGGERAYDFNFQRPIDATVDGTNLPQWGDGSGSMPSDATGSQYPSDYEQCFNEYVSVGLPDSATPARFKYGQYHTNGALDDHLDVVVEQPRVAELAGERKISVSMTLIATINGEQKVDATLNDGR